jgi:hypothetical protein
MSNIRNTIAHCSNKSFYLIHKYVSSISYGGLPMGTAQG